MKTTKFNILLLLTIISVLFSCSSKSDISTDSNGSETGKAGSYARFAVVGDYLYTVTDRDMKLFQVEDETQPYFSNDINIGWGIETIFPKDSLLFIGSQDGMTIYSIKNAQSPEFISRYSHITSCDPVVVDRFYAWVTLHTNDGDSRCGWNDLNELHLVDVSDIYNPRQVQAYPMTRPLGLGVDSNLLFLCDNGLKVYNIENAPDIELIQHFTINANDVIPLGDLLLVVGDDGLYQYSYSEDGLEFISKIEVCSANNIL